MVSYQPLSRRTLLHVSAATLAGCLLAPSVIEAKQTPIPAVAGMRPSSIGASESFKAARGADIVLNTQAQTETEVQNRFDLAVLEMFNVMKANEYRLVNGEMASFLSAGNIPVGMDTATFGEELANAPGEYPITCMFFPESAVDRNGGQWGVFDARQGLRVQFIDEPGLFDVTVGVAGQIFGFTPRLTEDMALQLDIYMQPEDPRSNPSIQFPDIAEDVSTTWIASNMIQIMMMSYGSISVFDPYHKYPGVATQMDMLFLPPYTANDPIASLMLNKPVGSGNYVDFSDTSRTCLLDYRPLSPRSTLR